MNGRGLARSRLTKRLSVAQCSLLSAGGGRSCDAGQRLPKKIARRRYLDRKLVPFIPPLVVVLAGPPIDELPNPGRRKSVPLIPKFGNAAVLEARGPVGPGLAFREGTTVAPIAFVAGRLVPIAGPAALDPIIPVTPPRSCCNAPIALRWKLRNTTDGG
jgi:hypothetical protein